MSIEKLHDQQLNGLALDLMQAKNNIFLFKEIKDNWEKIKALPNEDIQWIIFLKDTSVQQLIMYLSKLYDSSGERKNKETRCIRDLLKQIKYQEVNKPIIVDFIWSQFCKKNENALELIQFKPEYGAENLISHIQTFLDTEFNSKTSQEFVLKKLKELRNKNVAHNENTEITSQLLFEESEKLIFLADAILDFINTFLSLGQSVIYSDLDYVINLQLDRIINKVNHEQL